MICQVMRREEGEAEAQFWADAVGIYAIFARQLCAIEQRRRLLTLVGKRRLCISPNREDAGRAVSIQPSGKNQNGLLI